MRCEQRGFYTNRLTLPSFGLHRTGTVSPAAGAQDRDCNEQTAHRLCRQHRYRQVRQYCPHQRGPAAMPTMVRCQTGCVVYHVLTPPPITEDSLRQVRD